MLQLFVITLQHRFTGPDYQIEQNSQQGEGDIEENGEDLEQEAVRAADGIARHPNDDGKPKQTHIDHNRQLERLEAGRREKIEHLAPIPIEQRLVKALEHRKGLGGRLEQFFMRAVGMKNEGERRDRAETNFREHRGFSVQKIDPEGA